MFATRVRLAAVLVAMLTASAASSVTLSAEAQSAPSTPASVTVTRAEGTLTATWPAVSGATSYHVTYTPNSGTSWNLAALNHPADPNTDTNTNTVSITISNVNDKNVYIVGVRARNSNGDSDWRNSPSVAAYTPPPPAAPTGLTAVAGMERVTLAWDDPLDSTITHYALRSKSNGAWSTWTVINATTSHVVTGLTNDVAYRFQLYAINAGGNSATAPTASPGYISATPLAGTPPRPNVVVIFADDLGYKDVSFTGATDISTPNIDKLAQSGVTFSRGYVAAPLCTPSRVGLLTGRYPLRSGMQVNLGHVPQAAQDPLWSMASTEKTFAKYLQETGYTTGLVGKWQIGSADGVRPLDRGFDYFYGMLGGGHDYFGGNNKAATNSYYYPMNEDGHYHWLLGTKQEQLMDFTDVRPYLTDALTDKAIDFITAASSSEDPWLLYLPYNTPHAPLQAPSDLVQKYSAQGHGWGRARYLAMIDNLDQNVGRVMATITDAGEYQDTLVFFLSDNGGYRGGKNWADNGVLKEGKGSFYEGGIRVPFIGSWPGRWPAGSTYDKPVISLDIAATAMAMAGAAADAALPLDGVNLDGYVRSTNSGNPHEALFWHWVDHSNGGHDARYAVVSGDLKLVKNTSSSTQIGLYNLSSDPGETNDLLNETSTEPSQARTDAERLRTLWNTWNSANQVSRYDDFNQYVNFPPFERTLRTRQKLCETEGAALVQVGADFVPVTSTTIFAPVRASAPGSQTTPALSVTSSGSAAWLHTLAQDLTFVQAELRWLERGAEGIDDWTGKSSIVFTSGCVNFYHIPSLKTGVTYKAQLVVTATDSDGDSRELKSNIVTFQQPLPVLTLAVTNAGAATWNYTLPQDLVFVRAEVSWLKRGTKKIDDWTGRSVTVFSSGNVNSHQLLGLQRGVDYKAQVVVTVTDANSNNRSLKSNIAIFRLPLPAPTLVVTDSGAATWSFLLADDYTYVYTEVRWRERGTEYINDWTGKSNMVFYSEDVNSYQIPGLTSGTKYKAKVFVGARDSDNNNRYLKSNTVVFTASS